MRHWHTLPSLLIVVFAWAVGTAAKGASDSVRDAPLSIPPAQYEPWEPSEDSGGDVPTYLARELDDVGFPDPRGLPYHKLQMSPIQTQSGHASHAHGWVIPQHLTGPQRFAILWDGTIQRVNSIGREADVASDVRQMLESRQRASAAMWWGGEQPESTAVPLTPATTAIVVRLGHPALALQLWDPLSERQPKWVDRYEEYALWAITQWTHEMMEQAVMHHARGNDRLCLSTLERMIPAYEKIAAEQARRIEFRDPLDLWHLELYPALLKDQRRRNAMNRRDTPPAKFAAESSERIAQLIHELDQSALRCPARGFAMHCGRRVRRLWGR